MMTPFPFFHHLPDTTASSWRMTVLRVIRLLLIWQYPHRHRGVKNQILVVPLVLPAPMLVVPFPLPLEPIWVVALMPLGRPPLPIGLVSLGSITRVPALGSPWLP